MRALFVRSSPRWPVVALVGSYAACLIVLGIYNWLVFGGPLTTGVI